MRALVLLALAACQSTPPPPAPVVKLETCAAALADRDPATRKLALECMGRETTGISGPATPLRTHVVATLVDLVDHEPDPGMHRTATFVLAMIERDVAPEPKLVAKLNAIARTALAKDPELAALAWIPSSEAPDAAKLPADERTFALALLGADLEPHVYDVPFAYASTLDQTQKSTTNHNQHQPNTHTHKQTNTNEHQDKLCPTLRDAAVDVFAANIAALYRTTSIDLKILTPAQHAKLRTAAHAFRARATDPHSADRYLAELLH